MNNRGLPKKSLTDWTKVDALRDAEIDYTEIPEADEEFWRQAQVMMPVKKKLISIRLDEDVVAWFKSQGKGYQSRINAVLRAYKEAHTTS